MSAAPTHPAPAWVAGASATPLAATHQVEPHTARAAPQGLAQVLSSDQLLQGRAAIHIAHNGTVYRLQATRQGKLILTK
ncbi:hemin uptake protein HemP [Hydrogenophaga soli]